MTAQSVTRNQVITIDPAIIVHINMLLVASAAGSIFGGSAALPTAGSRHRR
jgi:hypothetical protein